MVIEDGFFKTCTSNLHQENCYVMRFGASDDPGRCGVWITRQRDIGPQGVIENLGQLIRLPFVPLLGARRMAASVIMLPWRS